MTEWIYQTLQSIGYTHPLHPIMTHLPVGVVMAALIFGIIAKALNKDALAQTAKHSTILSLIGLIPTIILGITDWQHRFGGTWLFPIQAKLVLALVLAALLVSAALAGKKKLPLGLYGLCFLAVVGLGYFGGELVYGKTASQPQEVKSDDALVRRGAEIFSRDCAACHHTDSTETKVGPGLKGLLSGINLPESGRPATEENVRLQLKKPYKAMPSFSYLKAEEVDALIAYLRSL